MTCVPGGEPPTANCDDASAEPQEAWADPSYAVDDVSPNKVALSCGDGYFKFLFKLLSPMNFLMVLTAIMFLMRAEVRW